MRARRQALSALAGAVLLAAAAAEAGDDVSALRIALAREQDPARRAVLMPRLALLGGAEAAAALAKAERGDPEVSVRAAAARALGIIDAESALDLLAEAVVDGGPRAARAAVSKALSRRPGALARVKKALDDPRTSEADRVLWIHALAAFRDEASRAALVAETRAAASAVREAAARALARRKDAKPECLLALLRLLDEAKGRESQLLALDAVETALDPSMRPVLERLVASQDRAVRDAARHLLDVLLARAAGTAPPAPPGPPAAPAPGDRYAPPEKDDDDAPPTSRPGEPPLRARFDVVYAVDVTGSTSTTLEGLRRRMTDEMALLARLGASVRVGVVAYRGSHGAEARRGMEVLLPSFDLDRVAAFLRDLVPGGVDDRGAAVAAALSEALDRTPWRWDATRDVHLIADSGCDDPAAAGAAVSVHFRADATRTSVAFVLRTRTRLPPEYAEIARLGGTDAPETIK